MSNGKLVLLIRQGEWEKLLECGEYIPTIETAAKLADFLGVSMDYLCGMGARRHIQIATF